MKAYFTDDGTFGSANEGEIIILNTDNFTDDDWDEINECADLSRMALAQKIAKKRNG